MTEELQATRDRVRLADQAPGGEGRIVGSITLTKAGLWDTSKSKGLPWPSIPTSTGRHDPPTLAIRPWHPGQYVVSLRELTNTATTITTGSTTQRFGLHADPDGDGYANETTRADVTVVSVSAGQRRKCPGEVIPRDPEIEAAAPKGEEA